MIPNPFDDKRHISAFREAVSVPLIPVIQAKFPYNISSRHLTSAVTGTGAITQVNSMAKVSTGSSTSSTGSLLSKDTLVYQPGQGGLTRFTAVFTTPVAGSKQEMGIGDSVDGYFVVCQGEEFGVLRRQNGTDFFTPIPHAGDGSDDAIGQLDITKGNIYQIQYQWLGYGQITYSVYNFKKERYVTLYKDDYPNKNIVPSTYNPSFPVCVYVENTTNASDVSIQTSSFAAFVEGITTKLVSAYSTENTKTITSEISVLSIRVKETLNSKTTRGLVRPKSVSVGVDGTKPVTIRVYEDATLGGTPSYASVHAESIVESDTAGTTVTGGYKLASLVVSKTGSAILDLNKLARLHKGSLLSVTAQSSNSSDVSIGLNWTELL